MVRINSNIPSMTAQMNLARSNRELSQTLQRLSTGLRISKGSDDPAGLIASETLRAEIASLGKAITNTERASNVIATAEASLAEVANLLIDIKGLAVESANVGALSKQEIMANQLQVDSAIQSITRIANTSTFAGRKLLNGSLGYQTSGVNTSSITALEVNNAQLGEQPYLDVTVVGTVSPEQGTLFLSNDSIALNNTTVFEIATNRGVEVLSFISVTSMSQIATAINNLSGVIGATAAASGSSVTFTSLDYGTDAFVSIRTLPSGASANVVNTLGVGAAAVTQRDLGVDIAVAINGSSITGIGRKITYNSGGLSLNMSLEAPFVVGNSTNFNITGGGFLFQIGPKIDQQQQISIGLKSVHASNLGSQENSFLSEVLTGGSKSLVGGQFTGAATIIEEAIQQIAVMRGRLGAFERNTLETNANSLRISLENVTAAESSIRDADFALETAKLTRSQVLVQAGTAVLGLANSAPQSVLALLQ